MITLRPALVRSGLLALALLLVACGEDPAPEKPRGPLDWAAASELNNRGIALMDLGKVAEAEAVFRELHARAPSAIEARVNLAIALLNTTEKETDRRDADYAEAERIFREVMRDAPDNPWAPYCLGILLSHLGREIEQELGAFEAAHRLRPEDPDVCYRYGAALQKRYARTRKPEDLAAAITRLEKAARLEPHFQGAWYSLFQARRRSGDGPGAEEALEAFKLFDELKPEVGKKLKLIYDGMGRYASAMRDLAPFGERPAAPAPSPIAFGAPRVIAPGTDAPAPAPDAAFSRVAVPAGTSLRTFLVETVLPSLAGGFALHDLDGDGTLEAYVADGRGPGRIVALDGRDLGALGRPLDAPGLRSLGGVLADVDHDGRPDLFVFGLGPNRLFLNRGAEGFVPAPGLEGSGAVTLAAQAVDADHDGDLDLVVANWLALPAEDAVAGEDCVFPDSFAGAANEIWNNDRPDIYSDAGRQGFSAVAGDSPVVTGARRSTALVAADFDRDGDVDLAEVVDGAPGRFFLNDRHWRFREDSSRWRLDDAGPGRGAVVFDADDDGRLDIAVLRGEGAADALWHNVSLGAAEDAAAMTPLELPAPAAGALAATSLLPIDLDNDGDLDLVRAVYAGADRTAATLEILRRDGKSWTVTATGLAAPRDLRGLAAVDVDGDGRRDVLASDAAGALHVLSNLTEGAGNWLVLELRGKRVNDTAPMWSNHFGLGAAVELGHGPQRVHRDLATTGSFLAGADPNLHFGLGEAERADYTRIIWPDLVMQNEIDLEANRRHLYHEVNRKASSCPVLFKSCGDGTFAFVTDFLGTGGLGFYVGPDRYAPPDADETVAIGEFAPDPDGRYRLRISEPMEEVCYVDELALIVVEHDEGEEILADERLAISGPAPSGRPLLFRRTFAPRGARSGDGRDTLDELLRIDRRYQKGLRRDPRFLGYLAAPSLVELSFDAEAIRAARPSPEARLVLLVDGSVEYPYSHVNYAGTQVDLEAESLGVEVERDGTWHAVATDVGYPAGMQRAMTIPLGDLDGGELARLRLRTGLEIYLDRVRVGWAEEVPPTAIARHEFDAAELRFLGYPLEYSPDGALPTIYDYQRISPRSDWKSLGGRFTRYGDVRELLRAPDDRYVLMNHGDEIALEIAAERLGPLPEGRRRTFFLRAHGWCKDMDPYTATPDTVEPLPWSTMGDYPPREPFPWTEAARRWDREWNTRVVAPTFEPAKR